MSANTRDKAKTTVESGPASSCYALVFAMEEVVVPALYAQYACVIDDLSAGDPADILDWWA